MLLLPLLLLSLLLLLLLLLLLQLLLHLALTQELEMLEQLLLLRQQHLPAESTPKKGEKRFQNHHKATKRQSHFTWRLSKLSVAMTRSSSA